MQEQIADARREMSDKDSLLAEMRRQCAIALSSIEALQHAEVRTTRVRDACTAIGRGQEGEDVAMLGERYR